MVSVLSAIGAALLTFALTFFLYYQPVLAKMDQQNAQKQQELNQKQQELEAANRRTQQAEKERTEAQQALNAIKSQWKDAKYKFLQPLSGAIQDGNKSEKQWEGKPHPSPRQLAEMIVKNRDALRDRINQIKADLTAIYDALDSDIDALDKALRRQPPANDEELRRVMGRLSPGQWAGKEKLIEDLIQKTVPNLGYPNLAAATP